MDAGVFYIVIGLVGALVGFLYANYTANSKIVMLSGELEEAKKAGRKSTKKALKKADSGKDQSKQTNKDLKTARDEIKSLKKQVYDLKEAAKAPRPENESSGKKGKKKKKSQDNDIIFTLREEVGDLKAQLATALDRAAPAPKEIVEESEPEEVDPNESPELQELKKGHREQIRALKEKHADSEREYKQKLKKTSSNVDKQRRRADNNDKAYKITQRQVDGLQERIAYLEKELRSANAGIAAPVVETAPAAETAPAVETAEIPVHASMDNDPPSEATHDLADDAPAPGFIMTKEAEPNTIEISEDLADDLIAEVDRSDAFDEASEPRETLLMHGDDVRSTAPLTAFDAEEKRDPAPVVPDDEDSSGNTAMLTPKALADAGFSADADHGPTETSSVDDAWAEFDVD